MDMLHRNTLWQVTPIFQNKDVFGVQHASGFDTDTVPWLRLIYSFLKLLSVFTSQCQCRVCLITLYHNIVLCAGHLTPRSDVYSFGVVLLELLTGRKSLDKQRPAREQNLTEWALPLLKEKKKVLNIIDPRLEGNYPVKGAHKAAMLAYHCLNKNPKARPLMRDIVDSLEPLTTYSELPMEKTFTIITEVAETDVKKKEAKWLKSKEGILFRLHKVCFSCL